MVVTVVYSAHAVEGSWENSLAFCRKLAVFDTWSSLAVHIAMDNTVVMEEISKWLRVWLPQREPQLESWSLNSTGTSQQVEA